MAAAFDHPGQTIHDAVLNPGELSGRAQDESLDGALARVENRLAYGMIADMFDLAAAYAMAIAQGHCFNDANMRTAYRTMVAVLDMNGAREPDLPTMSLARRSSPWPRARSTMAPWPNGCATPSDPAGLALTRLA